MNVKEKAGRFGKDFAAFAIKGNVLDLAVGVMIGGAFSKIVSSLVGDVIMPLIGRLTGGVDVKNAFVSLDGQMYESLDAAVAAGAPTLNYGAFLQAVIDFVIIAFCIFIFLKVISKALKKIRPHETVKNADEPEKKPILCIRCKMEVKEGATRCPYCTSDL